jgi:hypothetical protein
LIDGALRVAFQDNAVAPLDAAQTIQAMKNAALLFRRARVAFGQRGGTLVRDAKLRQRGSNAVQSKAQMSLEVKVATCR